jgi:hypothetical protein
VILERVAPSALEKGLQTMRPIYTNTEFSISNFDGSTGVCTVRVYADARTREALVIIVEDDRNWEHRSITNAVEDIAVTLDHRVFHGVGRWTRVRWLEVYANLLHPVPSFDWIEFDEGLTAQRWRPASRREVEMLVGETLNFIPPGDEREMPALEGA